MYNKSLECATRTTIDYLKISFSPTAIAKCILWQKAPAYVTLCRVIAGEVSSITWKFCIRKLIFKQQGDAIIYCVCNINSQVRFISLFLSLAYIRVFFLLSKCSLVCGNESMIAWALSRSLPLSVDIFLGPPGKTCISCAFLQYAITH